jgi:hypothetical protein
LYRCCIVLVSERKNEVPIEWATSLSTAKAILSMFENILIYHLQPELNTLLKRRTPNTSLGVIHIQNVSSEGRFLHDAFIWP